MRVLSLWESPFGALFIPPDNRIVPDRMISSPHQPPLLDNLTHQPSTQLVVYQQNKISPKKISGYMPMIPPKTPVIFRNWVALAGLILGVVLLVVGMVVLLQPGDDPSSSQHPSGSRGFLEFSVVLLGLGVVCLISVSIFYACSKMHQADLQTNVHGDTVV